MLLLTGGCSFNCLASITTGEDTHYNAKFVLCSESFHSYFTLNIRFDTEHLTSEKMPSILNDVSVTKFYKHGYLPLYWFH